MSKRATTGDSRPSACGSTGPGGLVARQKPVELGDIVGNDYVVLGGIAPGDRVIVSGTQMLADGVPVQAKE